MLRGERINLFQSSNQEHLKNEYRVVVESIERVLPYIGDYDAKPNTPEFYQQQKFYFPNGEKGDWTPLPLKEGDRPWRPQTDNMIERDVMECVQAAYAIHLGIRLPFDDIKPYLHKGAEVASLYFWGDWRTECRKNMNWIDTFSRGILLSLLIGDKAHLTKIAEWVDNDLKEDGMGTYTSSDAWYFISLGLFLQNKPYSEMVDRIKSKSRRRPKILINVLESIDRKDEVAFEKEFTSFMNLFTKNEVSVSEWFESNISREASVLWNIARCRKLNLPVFSEKIMDRIIAPQSIGLEK